MKKLYYMSRGAELHIKFGMIPQKCPYGAKFDLAATKNIKN